MSPVAASCPVHGAFASRAFGFVDSTNVSLAGNSEPCPAPGCGQSSQIMEGKFNFDESSFGTVVSAPEWSQAILDSIQGAYTAAASKLEHDQEAVVSDVMMELNATIDRKINDARAQDQAVINALQQNVAKLEKRGEPGRPNRSRLVSALKAAGYALGIYAMAVGAAADTIEVATWATEVFVWGEAQYSKELAPTVSDLPPYLRNPPSSPAQR